MCGAGPARKLTTVHESTVPIRLELRLAEDVPEGVASLGDGPATHFAGWLGLMAAIETLTTQCKEDHANADH
jgi:hypothetical protein